MVGIAGEIQQRIKQASSRGPADSTKTVAVRPFRVGSGRISRNWGKQNRSDIGGAHRQAGMAGFRLFPRPSIASPTDRIWPYRCDRRAS